MKVRIIGADGRMGRLHRETYAGLGMKIVEQGEDIVSIASPDRTHGRYVEDALRRGKHVFCEKPLCTTIAELHRIEELSALKPRLHIGQNFPLRYVFGNYRLGRIYRADATYQWARPHKLGVGWRTGDYSLVMGGMIHLADLMIHLLGSLSLQECEAFVTNGHGIPDTITALCVSETATVCLNMDGTTGPRHHAHHVLMCGVGGIRSDSNFEPTDKTRAIREFVAGLGDEPRNDFRATRLCLEIDGCIASTSPAR